MSIETDKLNTVGKAMLVFEKLREAGEPLSVKEIADVAGLNKSSLHHHIKTLADLGYLQQNSETRKYDIGLRLVHLGQSYLQRLDVRERGHFYLEQLSKDLGQTSHMLLLDGTQVVYVDKIEINQQPGALKCSSYIGMHTDVHSTASGKVLLSNLDEKAAQSIVDRLKLTSATPHTITEVAAFQDELKRTKARGYGLDLQEHSHGLQCIAVPIWNLHGQCVAAVSVSSPVSTVDQSRLESDILVRLQETGRQISSAMGFKTP